ncbi:MAG TPA: hypothetical protein VFW19_03135 [Allosphingosinicella sp.]|nr:hypothetical protein [Allosphingosinicella sp.]
MTGRPHLDREAVRLLVAHRAKVRDWWERAPARDATRRDSDAASEATPGKGETAKDRELRRRLVGLALAGGGIRSATFSLGLIQALARRPAGGWAQNALGRIDILSTVSGGGYIGCFLRSLFVPGEARGIAPQGEGAGLTADNASESPNWRGAVARQYQFAQMALTSRACERRLDWPRADGERGVRNPIWWLREHSRYLAPNGLGDYGYAFAYLIRNWTAMIYVFALAMALILAVPILVEGRLADALPNMFGWTWMPLPPAPPPPCPVCAGAPPAAAHFVPLSPIAALAILPLLASIVLGIAYWMTQAMSPNEKAWPRLWVNLAGAVAAMLAGIVLILFLDEWIGRFPKPPSWPPLMLDWPLLGRTGHWHFGFFWVAAAGLAAAAIAAILALLMAAATQIGGGKSALLTSELRRRLTAALAASNVWLLLILLVALVDSCAAALDSWFSTTPNRFSALGAFLVPIFAFLINKLPGWFEGRGKGKAAALLRPLLPPIAFAAGLLLYGAVAIIVGATLHHVAWTGPDWQSPIHWRPFLLLAAAILVLALIAGGSTGFINLSSLHGLYAARLTRAYLGASNMGRLEKVAASHRGSGITENDAGDYIQPELYSRLDLPAPLHLINTTLNETVDPRSQLVERDRKGEMLTLTPMGVEIGIDRAVGWTALGEPKCAEHLSLGQWCAISGAAASAGMGRFTNLGYALALSFANVRLGYWWWSPGVDPDFRRRRWQRPFETFLYLRDEMAARYSRHRSRKYVTDGGHFENSGAYRLLKRRIPLILVSDNAADPDHVFANLETLVRIARIDLGGEIRILGGTARERQLKAWGCDPGNYPLFVDPDAEKDWRRAFGKPAEPASYLILEAAFDDATVHLLWIKPRLLPDLPPDIIGYATANPNFPQQTTADQFFDEAQWESYRRLGGLTMDRLLDALPKLFPDSPWAPAS